MALYAASVLKVPVPKQEVGCHMQQQQLVNTPGARQACT
jgi:hypothetical protein